MSASFRDELMQELQLLKEVGQIGLIDEARFKRDLKTRLADMGGLLARHISVGQATAQNALRTAFALRKSERGRTVALSNRRNRQLPSATRNRWRFAGPWQVVSPTGFEPVLPA